MAGLRPGRLVTALVAVPVFYILAGFAGALVPGPRADIHGAPTEQIGLARGSLHYDILLPLTPESRADFAFARAQGLPVDHPKAEWLVLGWGSESFYTSVSQYADIRASVLWRAVAGDAAVLRMDLAGDIGAMTGIDWVDVSASQMAALRKAVLAALERDETGQPVAIPPAATGQTHVFYRAIGRFHLGHTCNVWIAETLRSAGVPLGLWTPTTQALSLSLWWNAA